MCRHSLKEGRRERNKAESPVVEHGIAYPDTAALYTTMYIHTKLAMLCLYMYRVSDWFRPYQ